MTKIFFSDIVEWSSKTLWKMISADVKANKNNKKYKIWWLILQRSTFKTRNTIKMGCIFHSILVGTPFILILFVKSRRVRGRGGGSGSFAYWTKSLWRDQSYLLTVPKGLSTKNFCHANWILSIKQKEKKHLIPRF